MATLDRGNQTIQKIFYVGLAMKESQLMVKENSGYLPLGVMPRNSVARISVPT